MLKFFSADDSSISATEFNHADWLGALCFSQKPALPAFSSAGHLPCAHLLMTPLGQQTSIWQSLQTMQDQAAIHSGQSGDLCFRHDARLLFGVISQNEALFANNGDAPLQSASQNAYEHVFATLHELEFPYLLRCWNYFADINGVSDGLERYRQFNLGRQLAFDKQPQLSNQPPPAACAIGTQRDPRNLFTLAFLATRTMPIAISNRRQLEPRDYPIQYGPRSPLFSRASLLIDHHSNSQQLFLSGTASIAGHQTLYIDDVVAQTEETIRNIEAVLDAANEENDLAFTLEELDYTVYIRHAEHLPQVKAALQSCIGKRIKASYLQADICRKDLLVEIEGYGSKQRVPSQDESF